MARLSLYPPSHPQSIGQVLDAGFALFRATLAPCMPYGALLVIAGQLGNFRELAAGRLPRAAGVHDPEWWLWYGVGLAFTLLLWCALILRQHTLAEGAQSSMRAELRTVCGRLPELALLALLAVAGIGIGLALLIVPGLYLAIAFVFAAPLLMLRQRSGALRALADSTRLVRGHWWRTTLMLAIVIAMTFAVYAVLATIIAAASVAIGWADRTLVAALSAVAGVVVGSISAPFGSAMVLAIFGYLRARIAIGAVTE